MEKERKDIYSAMKRAFAEEYPDAPFQIDHFVLQLEGNFSIEPQNLPKQTYWRNLVPAAVAAEAAVTGYFIFKNPETDVEMIYQSSVRDGEVSLTNLYNGARFCYDQEGCLRTVLTEAGQGYIRRAFHYCDGHISGARVSRLYSENGSITHYDSNFREVRVFQELRHENAAGELVITEAVSEAGQATDVRSRVVKLSEPEADSIPV